MVGASVVVGGIVVVVGASVVVGGNVVVAASVVVARVETTAAAVGAGRPDSVTGGGGVAADADEPFCEHDESSSANAEITSGADWDTARRFISERFYSIELSERRQLEPDRQCVFHTAHELRRLMRMGHQRGPDQHLADTDCRVVERLPREHERGA